MEPHEFEPLAKQIMNIQDSDAVFINGAGIELRLDRISYANVIDPSRDLPVMK